MLDSDKKDIEKTSIMKNTGVSPICVKFHLLCLQKKHNESEKVQKGNQIDDAV